MVYKVDDRTGQEVVGRPKVLGRVYLEDRVQVRVGVCIGSESVCVYINGCEKGDHCMYTLSARF